MTETISRTFPSFTFKTIMRIYINVKSMPALFGRHVYHIYSYEFTENVFNNFTNAFDSCMVLYILVMCIVRPVPHSIASRLVSTDCFFFVFLFWRWIGFTRTNYEHNFVRANLFHIKIYWNYSRLPRSLPLSPKKKNSTILPRPFRYSLPRKRFSFRTPLAIK